jgi:hypothetical protein
MQRYVVYLETALHVADGTTTQHLVFVTPLLLSTAIALHLVGYILEYS